jgi:hypothetical protein
MRVGGIAGGARGGAAAVLAAAELLAAGTVCDEHLKVVGSLTSAGEEFGRATATDGDTAVVTAPLEGGGAAYVFMLVAAPNQWVEVRRIVGIPSAAGDDLGLAIALHGDTLLLGAPLADPGGADSGRVHAFGRDQGGAGNWGQISVLTRAGGGAGDEFGGSLALEGDLALIGAEGANRKGDDSGVVSVHRRHQGGADQWGGLTELGPDDGEAFDEFGDSVALAGTIAAIGAPGVDDLGEQSGAVYIFGLEEESDTWVEVTKVTAADGAAGDAFGQAVALERFGAELYLMVGAIGDDDRADGAGAVYVFRALASAPALWEQEAKLTASDGTLFDMLGAMVSIEGLTVAASAPLADGGGAAYVFGRCGARIWTQEAKLVAADANEGDLFGRAVIGGSTILVGAQRDDEVGQQAGAAYFFHAGACAVQVCVPCAGDVDGSGAVDVADLTAVVLAWGGADPAADVSGNGIVGVEDLAAVILAWGPCP